jgi:hypothetical protein
MLRLNLERNLNKTLRRGSRYKLFWICSVCGNPRRASLVLPAKRCWKCKQEEPNYLVIQERREPAERHSLTRSKKADLVMDMVKAADVELPIPKKRILSSVRVHREVEFPKRTFFQIFEKGYTYSGLVSFDPCMNYIPYRVRKDMSKTKMMQIRIPADLHKWFKRYTQLNDITMTSIVVAYLERLRTRAKNSSDVEQI